MHTQLRILIIPEQTAKLKQLLINETPTIANHSICGSVKNRKAAERHISEIGRTKNEGRHPLWLLHKQTNDKRHSAHTHTI